MQKPCLEAPEGASPGVIENPATRIGNMHAQQISVNIFPLNKPASLQTNASVVVVVPSADAKNAGNSAIARIKMGLQKNFID